MIIPALFLAASLAVAADAPTTTKEFETFVKVEISQLTPAYIQHMMAVNEKEVPPKLLPRFQARKLELNALRHLGEGNRKGSIRIPDKACAIPDDAKSD